MLRQDNSNIDSQRNGNGSELTHRFRTEDVEGLDLLRQVQRLEEMIILDGMKLPLTGRKLVDEEQLLAQLTNVERSIPQTIQAAEKVLLRREEIINRANDYAQEIIKSAEQRAAQIADKVRIVQRAEMEAEQIRQQVNQEAETLRQKVRQEAEGMRQQIRQESDKLQQQVKQEADGMRQRASEELEGMRRQVLQEIDELRRSARAEQDQIQSDADHYADRVLTEMERQFTEMLRVLHNGRQHLRADAQAARRPPG
jgi:F0F1-type ATP synthase membrane subunit b/b'